MDIRNEALNLLTGLSNSVGAEYEDQDLALAIVETTIQKLVKESDSLPLVSVSLFNEALRVLRDLAEHQNGAPLIRHKEEYDKTMTEVWDFLEANET